MKQYVVGVLILLLNIIDSIFTHIFIFNYNVPELNIIIKYYINNFVYFWWIPKIITIVIGTIVIIYYWEKFSLARIGGYVLLIIYIYVFLYHMYGIYLLKNAGII